MMRIRMSGFVLALILSLYNFSMASAQQQGESNVESPPKGQSTSEVQSWVDLLEPMSKVLPVFLAAGLAFLASEYRERKTWRRRKEEQVRDEQFKRLIDCAKKLGVASRWLLSIEEELRNIQLNSGDSAAQRELVRAEIAARSNNWAEELNDSIEEFEILQMEFKLLHVAEEPQTLLTTCINILRSTKTIINGLSTPEGALDLVVIESSNFREKTREYINSAVVMLEN